MPARALDLPARPTWHGLLAKLVLTLAVVSMTAALAVPRLQIEVDSQRKAAVERFADSLEVTAELTHGLWLSQSQPTFLVYGGRQIDMDHGYPDLNSVHWLDPSRGVMRYEGQGIWTHSEAVDSQLCRVQYQAPQQATHLPTVQVITSGC